MFPRVLIIISMRNMSATVNLSYRTCFQSKHSTKNVRHACQSTMLNIKISEKLGCVVVLHPVHTTLWGRTEGRREPRGAAQHAVMIGNVPDPRGKMLQGVGSKSSKALEA